MTYYRGSDNDPEDDYVFLLIGMIVFLFIVGPCMLAIKLHR